MTSCIPLFQALQDSRMTWHSCICHFSIHFSIQGGDPTNEPVEHTFHIDGCGYYCACHGTGQKGMD